MGLASLTRPQLIYPRLPGSDRPSVLRILAERVADSSQMEDAELLYRRLSEREELGSTGLGSGVAVPHCKMDDLDEVVVAIGLCPDGIDFGAEDGEPVRVLFLVVSPESAPAEHLQSLASISKWVKANEHVQRILELDDANSIYELLEQEDS